MQNLVYQIFIGFWLLKKQVVTKGLVLITKSLLMLSTPFWYCPCLTIEFKFNKIFNIKKMTISKKTILTLAFLFSLMASSWANDKEKAVKSKIKEVTVFLNRAQVTNTARVSLSAGKTLLVFEGLSTKLAKQSLQVAAKGNLTIMSVKHRINYLKSFSKARRIKQLEDSLEYYQDRIARVGIEKEVLNSEEKMILANKKIGGQKGVSAQELAEMAAFYRKRLSEIRFAVLRHNKVLRKYRQQKNKIKYQLRVENKNANKPTSEVMVTVSAKSAINANFELNYIVMNAGWRPIYDLRAKNSKSPIQLSYKAEVFQNTGIDWKNVDITLSTGNPSQSGYKPDLNPWYVNIYQSQKYYNRREAYRLRKEAEKVEKQALYDKKKAKSSKTSFSRKPNSSTVADFTKVVESTFATKFDISIPYSIPSNGKPQLVDVKSHTLKTIYNRSAVPKLDKDAFLMARLVDWEKFNLLSGKANIYFEGTFVGETYLNTNNTKDTLAISLGRDKRIIIDRKQIKDFSSKRFLGSKIKQTYGYEIAIRNTKNEAVELVIEEQIPVSKNNKVTVELLEAKGTKVDPTTGKVTWKLTLQPKQAAKVLLKYSIKYPKGKQISFGG
ncbi:conserved hypothetical protein [Microscilla marina ATCC 23134]|uniref:Mucoidy inhibitor MuiA family protein n=2 Tax=Microscilla marina TaxID=1027 RepID=A1ZDU8_MICM2|nr:conserved hypothetical protein [Microscilla marina ATCC 23134]